jgi:CubicO group peptidase (beta-lactamase class C family)
MALRASEHRTERLRAGAVGALACALVGVVAPACAGSAAGGGAAPPAARRGDAVRTAPGATPVASRLDSVVRAFEARGEFSGAVLVARDGRVVYEGAVGEADRELHVRNSDHTRFRIASTTKQFTAALVLRLVEAGRLRLDAPVVTYLPQYPRPQGARVTLRQLLTHTAGLPDYPRLAGFYDREAGRAHTPAELLALFDSLPLVHEPGARWAYSNSHYVVLGAIVERVTGQPYAVALRERLLLPLGLTDTAYDDPLEVVEGRARGYVRGDSGILNAPYIDPSTVYAAGMLRSTTRDLFRWAEALRTGRVFRDSTSAALLATPQVATGLPLGGYGFGVFVGEQQLGGRTVRVIQHGGTINGFAAGFWRMPVEGAVVVVLDNTMSGATPTLTRSLADALFAGG